MGVAKSDLMITEEMRSPRRPIGVSILAVLHFGGGVLLLGVIVLLFPILNRAAAPMESVGISPALATAALLLLSALAIASGIGMWMGTPWGWWCAIFYYVYSVARNANALLMVGELAEALPDSSRGAGYYYLKFGGRVIIHFLILLYFFKSSVLAFFCMQDVNRNKAVGILVGITVALFGLFSGLAWLTG